MSADAVPFTDRSVMFGQEAARCVEISMPEVSVVMPCLNEAETLEVCIKKAQSAIERSGIEGEVIVADNGSSDGSRELAESCGARVVPVSRRGYGSALMGGIAAAAGKYIIMGDADDSYDFTQVPAFVEQLRKGHDIVLGNRFRGGIKPGAMPFLHKYLGNPGLTRLGRLFFRCPSGDFYCGMRGFSKAAYERMNLRTTGMEFATEMIVKATLLKMRITEIPTTLSPDGRSRPPHLRTWRDGWRTLRFFLLYSPRWLFLYPGILLMLLGTIAGAWLLPAQRSVGHLTFDVHTLLYAASAVLLGFQSVAFAAFSKLLGISQGLLPPDPRIDKLYKYVTLEVGLVVGGALLAMGLGGSVWSLHMWDQARFGPLDYAKTMRVVIPSVLALALGVQVIFASFFGSFLRMAHK
jgi:glycosyltransferase involved in cell wall biosynthesis